MSLKLVEATTNDGEGLSQDVDGFICDFQQGEARLIAPRPGTTFRNNIFMSRSERMIFKIYRLKERKLVEQFRAKWRIPSKKFGHRFGLAEWLNSRRAIACGASTATPLAYLEDCTPISCRLQVVAFENLCNHKTMLDAMRDGGLTPELLNSVEQTIWSLSSAGIFHIDLNCRNILVAANPTSQNKIIDWEYACFGITKAIDLHAYYLGYLYFGGGNKFISEQNYDRWAREKIEQRAADTAAPHPEGDNHYYAGKTNAYPRDLRYALFA